MERNELTKWLKMIIAFTAIIGVFLCFIIAPFLGREAVSMYPELDYMYWPYLIFIWVTAVALSHLIEKASELKEENDLTI